MIGWANGATDPCDHRERWHPVEILMGARESLADVVCTEPGCGWHGRVPAADVPCLPVGSLLTGGTSPRGDR